MDTISLSKKCYNPACSEPGVHLCSRCSASRYCSGACQKEHWPKHKAACKATAQARVAAQAPATAPLSEAAPAAAVDVAPNTPEMIAMRASFATVETYEDLLERNIDYLEGRLLANPYTHTPLSLDSEMMGVAAVLTEITRLGYYTITGQIGKAAYNVFDGTNYKSVEQRGYTSGWLLDADARRLRDFLDACPQRNEIYYRIDFDNSDGYYVQQNMPFNSKGSFNLGRDFQSPTSHAARVTSTGSGAKSLIANPGTSDGKKTSDGERRCASGTLDCRLEWTERVNCWDDVMHRKNVFYQYREFPKCMTLFLKCAGVYICTREYNNSACRVEEIMKAFLLSVR